MFIRYTEATVKEVEPIGQTAEVRYRQAGLEQLFKNMREKGKTAEVPLTSPEPEPEEGGARGGG